MTARSVLCALPLVIHRQNLGIAFGKPDRRRASGSTHNGGDARFPQLVHHQVEPIPVSYTHLDVYKRQVFSVMTDYHLFL